MTVEWKQIVLVGDAGAAHDPVTVTDSGSINFTLTGQEITAVVLPAGVDHDGLLNVHQNVNTVATPTFAGIIIANGGTIGQAAGPLLNFDNTNNYLEITGCNVGIGTTTPAQALELVGSLKLEATTTSTTGVIYKGTSRFIHNFQHPTGSTAVPTGRNTFIGVGAGNFTMGSTATSVDHASYNVGMGYGVLIANTTGYCNVALGVSTLAANTTGHYNLALGLNALVANTTGYYNLALGPNAGRYLTDGTTPNQTANNSFYLGPNTKALAAGGTNEIIIGAGVTGLGSNTVVLGNNSITITALKGSVGIGTTAPLAKLAINGGVNVGADSDPGDNNLNVTGIIYNVGIKSGATQAAAGAAANELWKTVSHATLPNNVLLIGV